MAFATLQYLETVCHNKPVRISRFVVQIRLSILPCRVHVRGCDVVGFWRKPVVHWFFSSSQGLQGFDLPAKTGFLKPKSPAEETNVPH